jgi:hypothetical protein
MPKIQSLVTLFIILFIIAIDLTSQENEEMIRLDKEYDKISDDCKSAFAKSSFVNSKIEKIKECLSEVKVFPSLEIALARTYWFPKEIILYPHPSLLKNEKEGSSDESIYRGPPFTSFVFSPKMDSSIYSVLNFTKKFRGCTLYYRDSSLNKGYQLFSDNDTLWNFDSEFGFFEFDNYQNDAISKKYENLRIIDIYYEDGKANNALTFEDLEKDREFFILRDHYMLFYKDKIFSVRCLENKIPGILENFTSDDHLEEFCDCDIDTYFRVTPEELEQIMKNLEGKMKE